MNYFGSISYSVTLKEEEIFAAVSVEDALEDSSSIVSRLRKREVDDHSVDHRLWLETALGKTKRRMMQ